MRYSVRIPSTNPKILGDELTESIAPTTSIQASLKLNTSMCDRFAHKVTETNRERVTYCIDM